MESSEFKVGEQKPAVSTKSSTGIVPSSKGQLTDRPWEEYVKPALDFVATLPDDIGQFFSDNKKPILNILLGITGLVTVYITLAVLDAINNVPLLSPLLELVGLGYTAWFIYRYIWQESTRDEFLAKFDEFKDKVIGNKS